MNRVAIVTALIIGVLAGAGGGYWYAASRHAPSQSSASEQTRASAGRQVLYWYDPMYPQQRFEKPGKSPYMDMQLVPKYADDTGGEGAVTVNPGVVQNLGVRFAEARVAPVAARLTAVGNVEYDERSFVLVQPRVGGYIERLHVRAALDMVREGAPLVEMLLPDWAAPQEEYLLLRKRDDSPLAAAARQRLILLGMNEEQIGALERSGVPQTRITLRAPVSGVIAELGARQGMTVNAGATLFRIADLASVWVLAEIPEAQAGRALPGGEVTVHVPAYPQERFAGRIGTLLPEVNATTRTVRARIEVRNAGMKLKPGMYASVEFAPRARDTLVIPTDAVIRTGKRDVVILAPDDGRFRPAEVEVGTETNDGTEIRKGLMAGDRVVVSGQFLIDSEASLRSALDRLQGAQAAVTPKPTGTHHGSGKVMSIDAARGRVQIDHGPIAGLNWPPMTMGFTAQDASQLARIRKGDTVEFDLAGKPNPDGEYLIVRIGPAGAPK